MPLAAICEIWTLELPVLVTVTGSVELLPVFTFPKFKLLVLNERVCVAATPVPVKETVLGEVAALLAIVMLPLAAPVAEG